MLGIQRSRSRKTLANKALHQPPLARRLVSANVRHKRHEENEENDLLCWHRCGSSFVAHLAEHRDFLGTGHSGITLALAGNFSQSHGVSLGGCPRATRTERD